MSDEPKTHKMWHEILSAPDDYEEWSKVKKLWDFATQLERENAALREALASAENGLRHGLMMEPVDPFQRGKVISWALDTVRAALKKEAQP